MKTGTKTKTKTAPLELKEKTYKVLSYCSIPRDIANSCGSLTETSCDTFVEYSVSSKATQEKYDDDFTLDNWLLEQQPDLAGQTILIHVDY